jgi:hypothetical protein
MPPEASARSLARSVGVVALLCALSMTGVTYSTTQLVPGAPTGVTGVSIEYGGVLITTVLHDDMTFSIDAFDGTTFTVLSDQFESAQNFYIWKDELYFSAQVDGTWEIYVYDGVTFARINASLDLLSVNAQEITASSEYLIFSLDQGGDRDMLVAWGGVIGEFVGGLDLADAHAGLRTFADRVLVTSYTDGVASQLAWTDGIEPDVLATDLRCETGVVWEGVLYRSCGNNTDGDHLWSLTAEGEFAQVAGSPAVPREPTVYDGKLYFTALGAADEFALYSFDGVNFTEITDSPAWPESLVVVGDKLMMRFGFYKGSSLQGITAFDGVTFTPVRDMPFSAENLISYGGSLYFAAVVDLNVVTYDFFRVTLATVPEGSAGGELAATGVSDESGSAGMLAGGLMILGLLAVLLGRGRATRRHSPSVGVVA